MKTLVLITSNFPFGAGESFIESELPFLSGNFEKIILIAQNINGEKTRVVPDNIAVYRYSPATSLTGFIYLPVLLIINCRIISHCFKEELSFRKSISYSLTMSGKLDLLKKIIKSVQLRGFIKKILKKEALTGKIVFYSYWLKTGAHAIAMLDNLNCIKIARAHGSDIYEEKTKTGYLPLLKFSSLKLDAIFFVSQNGKEYFSKKTSSDKKNLLVSYLGVEKLHVQPGNTIINNKFVIVSCSNIVALKRIDLIIYALENVSAGKEVEWLHFGDGILKNEMENLAEARLRPLNTIKFKFMGQYPNTELLKYYSTHQVNLFINVSSTEGVPVSIMEAQSFGIPVIATDTGGVKELVREGTGTLLPVEFSSTDLAGYIEYYINLSEKDTNAIRQKAIHNIDINFNSTSNYNNFIKMVNSIFDAAK